jgi:putative flippase GtrA
VTSPRASLRTVGRRLDLTRSFGSWGRLVARFGTVGLLAFVVDVGVFNLLRQATELGPLTSKTISVVLATSVAFAGNKSWTFSERGDRWRAGTAYVLFFAFNGVALLVSLACLAFSTYVLGLTSPLAENISTNVVGLGLGTLFRFWAYARWVFPTTAPPEDHRSTAEPDLAAAGRRA